MFCKGNLDSVKRIIEVLSYFNEVTGLVANMDKSNVLMAGIDETTRHSIGKHRVLNRYTAY